MKSDEIGICVQAFHLGTVGYQTIKSLAAGIKRRSTADRYGTGAFLMNMSGRGLMAVVSEARGVYHFARLCDECDVLGDRVIMAGFGDSSAIPSRLSFGTWKRLTGKRRPDGTGLELVPRDDGTADIAYGGDVICHARGGEKSNREVFEEILSGRRIGTRLRKGDVGMVKSLAKAGWDELDPMHSVDTVAGPARMSVDGGRLTIERLSGKESGYKPVASARVMCLADGMWPGRASADFDPDHLSHVFDTAAGNPVAGMYFVKSKDSDGGEMLILLATYEDGSSRAICDIGCEGRPGSVFEPDRNLVEAADGKKPVVEPGAEPVAKKTSKPVAKPKPVAEAKPKPVAEPKPKTDSGMSVTVVPSLVKAKDIPALKGMRVTPLRDARRRKVGYVGRKGDRVVLVWREWFANMPDSKKAQADVLKANKVTA